MKPGYWIGIMALIGATIGYAITRLTNWFDSGTLLGTVIGIAIGTFIYSKLKEKVL